MTVCERIYKDPRHNDPWFCGMMAQAAREAIEEEDGSPRTGQPKKATSEQRKEKEREYRRRYRAKKKAERLLAQTNGNNETV